MAQTGSRAVGAQSTPAPQTQTTPKTDADRVRELEVENAQLREKLSAAGSPAPAAKPTEPKFTFSEGQRDELERTGRTVSPFTGKRYVGTSVDDAREATAEEFAKAKPAKPAEK
ncbi:hypothetical protein O7634_24560 [Micromonospora sp. WMMD1120]|uniref:hypothetical protein n=1 Tax=Micromonospora sp. WMMD1120 TaxID=3016106 RepID=UPI0024177A4E|nr:hypothetical protein [Micromonospora sp. WMMD1120]MDG4809936.1 hypothetical protein [Micromonospora sp. WMMD1120]